MKQYQESLGSCKSPARIIMTSWMSTILCWSNQHKFKNVPWVDYKDWNKKQEAPASSTYPNKDNNDIMNLGSRILVLSWCKFQERVKDIWQCNNNISNEAAHNKFNISLTLRLHTYHHFTLTTQMIASCHIMWFRV